MFGPGATVFPGGAVDPADGDPALAERIIGIDDAGASADQGIARGGLAYRVAAVRECFEEAGILLAREAATGRPAEHDDGLATARTELNAGTAAFGDVLVARDLVLDARGAARVLALADAARRAPPLQHVVLRRPAPDGEDGTHDDNELVASAWVRPVDALAQHARGHIDLIFPTEMSLRALSHYDALTRVARRSRRGAARRERTTRSRERRDRRAGRAPARRRSPDDALDDPAPRHLHLVSSERREVSS